MGPERPRRRAIPDPISGILDRSDANRNSGKSRISGKFPKIPILGPPRGGSRKKGNFGKKMFRLGGPKDEGRPQKSWSLKRRIMSTKIRPPPPPRTKKALLRGGGPPPLPGPPLRAPPRGGPGGVVREGAKFVPGRIRRPADPEKQAPNLSLAD